MTDEQQKGGLVNETMRDIEQGPALGVTTPKERRVRYMEVMVGKESEDWTPMIDVDRALSRISGAA